MRKANKMEVGMNQSIEFCYNKNITQKEFAKRKIKDSNKRTSWKRSYETTAYKSLLHP